MQIYSKLTPTGHQKYEYFCEITLCEAQKKFYSSSHFELRGIKFYLTLTGSFVAKMENIPQGFFHGQFITSVRACVKTIGDYAFADCEHLEQVLIDCAKVGRWITYRSPKARIISFVPEPLDHVHRHLLRDPSVYQKYPFHRFCIIIMLIAIVCLSIARLVCTHMVCRM